MIWLPSSKNKSDTKYIMDFQDKLHKGQLKDNEVRPLNESIFAVEGLLNFEKCDANPARFLEEDVFEASIEIDHIDENGEVWISDSELLELYSYVTPLMEVDEDQKVSTLDLDVIEINSSSVQVEVAKTISRKQTTLPSTVEWFDENAIYPALGEDVLEYNYSVNNCPQDLSLNTPEIPCHIGYPSEPWPSWVYINDKLITNWYLLGSTWMNGEIVWQPMEKMWFTNVQNPQGAGTVINYETKEPQIDCSYGRRDKIYMSGNYNSSLLGLIHNNNIGCGCNDASEAVIAPQACGTYHMVNAAYPDEYVTGEQMNRYAQSCIDHIDEKLAYWTSLGLPNAGIASLKYYASCIYSPQWQGHGGPVNLRYHVCVYKIGTRN